MVKSALKLNISENGFPHTIPIKIRILYTRRFFKFLLLFNMKSLKVKGEMSRLPLRIIVRLADFVTKNVCIHYYFRSDLFLMLTRVLKRRTSN